MPSPVRSQPSRTRPDGHSTRARPQDDRRGPLLSQALEQGFLDRGVDDLTARLAAEIAVTTFRIAVTRWLDQYGDPDLPTTVNQTLAAMRHLTNTPST